MAESVLDGSVINGADINHMTINNCIQGIYTVVTLEDELDLLHGRFPQLKSPIRPTVLLVTKQPTIPLK